ncbi:MAG TPA: twin-arginine translocase TatA/TatE family subunit [Verrucomicrobiae bacterium]
MHAEDQLRLEIRRGPAVGRGARVNVTGFLALAGCTVRLMQSLGQSLSMLGFLNLADGEIVLILALILIMAGARRLPEIGRGLRRGFDEFQNSRREVEDEILDGIDGESRDAGKSVGGVYGKPAFEALTTKNETAELYDPAAVREHGGRNGGKFRVWLCRLLRVVRKWLRGVVELTSRRW